MSGWLEVFVSREPEIPFNIAEASTRCVTCRVLQSVYGVPRGLYGNDL